MVMDSRTSTSEDPASNTSPPSRCKCYRWKDAGAVPVLALPLTPSALREDRYWPRKFAEGQNLEIGSYNRAFIDDLKTQWNELDSGECDNGESVDGDSDEGDDESDDESDDDGDGMVHQAAGPLREQDNSVARIFMRGTLHRGTTEITETYHAQAAEVENFCEHIRLEDLEKSAPTRGTKRSVLLDERNAAGEFRASMGRMNYAQIYRALRADRFAMERCPHAQNQPNADQRRLYIHNITPHIAAALMATTSVHEAPAVRDLLYLHLARGTEIRVSIPSHGFRTFTLILSIPYYTMKQQNRPTLTDTRQWQNEELLRKFVSIPMPGKSRRTSTVDSDVELERLHEAQTTIVLTGFDEDRWTAIGLIDSNCVAESVREYQSKALTDAAMHRQDPMARGKLSVKCAIDPRLYYLWVWEARIGQVDTEWDGIVGCVDRAVTCTWGDDTSTLASQNAKPDEISQRLRDSIFRKARLASELKPLRHNLSNTVSAWRQFQKGDIKYFQDTTARLGAIGGTEDILRVIDGIYVRLETKLRKLEILIKELDDNHLNHTLAAESSREIQLLSKQSLGLTLAQNELVGKNIEVSKQIQLLSKENIELAQAQDKSAKFTHKLTNTSMFFLPFMLAFSLFSMSADALPFAPNTQALWFSLAVFIAITLLLVNYLDRTCQWLASKSKLGPHLWDFLWERLGLFLDHVRSIFSVFRRPGPAPTDPEDPQNTSPSRATTLVSEGGDDGMAIGLPYFGVRECQSAMPRNGL